MDHFIVLILFFAAVVINILSEVINNAILRYFSKPLLMPLLGIYYLLTGTDMSLVVIAALFFAFSGDVMLMFPDRKLCFMIGLASFFACHVCYIVYFVIADAFPAGVHQRFIWMILVYVFIGLVIYENLKKYLNEMRIPVIAYIVVILSMGFICAARYFSFQGIAFWLPLTGSVLFIVSDTILAFHLFRKPISYGMVYVMGTYIAAQLLLILGIVAE